MNELANQHYAIANLAKFLDKERNSHLFFQDGGMTLNIPSNQHDRLLEIDTYQNLITYYQRQGGQIVLGEGIRFEDLAEAFS